MNKIIPDCIVISSFKVDLFYDGCVIVELRDYRRSSKKNFDTTYILLKPTSQVLCSLIILFAIIY